MKTTVVASLAIVAFGGTLIGLTYGGMIDIPGVTPRPVKRDASDARRSLGDAAESPARPAPGLKPTGDARIRRDGTERLAKIWSSMDTESLVSILSQWDDGDALTVLALMEDKKLGELLSLLPADRAARISIGIKSLENGGKR